MANYTVWLTECLKCLTRLMKVAPTHERSNRIIHIAQSALYCISYTHLTTSNGLTHFLDSTSEMLPWKLQTIKQTADKYFESPCRMESASIVTEPFTHLSTPIDQQHGEQDIDDDQRQGAEHIDLNRQPSIWALLDRTPWLVHGYCKQHQPDDTKHHLEDAGEDQIIGRSQPLPAKESECRHSHVLVLEQIKERERERGWFLLEDRDGLKTRLFRCTDRIQMKLIRVIALLFNYPTGNFSPSINWSVPETLIVAAAVKPDCSRYFSLTAWRIAVGLPRM